MSSQSDNIGNDKSRHPPQFAPAGLSSEPTEAHKRNNSRRSNTQPKPQQQRDGKPASRDGGDQRQGGARASRGGMSGRTAATVNSTSGAGICGCGCGQWLSFADHHTKPSVTASGTVSASARPNARGSSAAPSPADADTIAMADLPSGQAASARGGRGGRGGRGAGRGGSVRDARDGSSSLIGALLTANAEHGDARASGRGRGRGRSTPAPSNDARAAARQGKSQDGAKAGRNAAVTDTSEATTTSETAAASEALLHTFGSGLPARTAALIASLGGAPQCAICVGEIGVDEQVWACSACSELTHYECVKQWAGASAATKKPDARVSAADGAAALQESRRGALQATLQMFRAQRASGQEHAATFGERAGVVSVREDAAVEEAVELSHGKFQSNVQKLLGSASALSGDRGGLLGVGDGEGFFGEEVDAAVLDRPPEELVGDAFACPACMQQHPGLPAAPRCFCARMPWPHYKPGLLPHSCGDTCGKPRAAPARVDVAQALQALPELQPLLPAAAASSSDELAVALVALLRQQQQQRDLIPLALDAPLSEELTAVSHPLFRAMPYTCPHPCSLPCHPGPCPPCAAHALAVPCACGRGKATLACASMPQATLALAMDVFRTDKHAGALSCGRTCGRALNQRIDAHVEPYVATAAADWSPVPCSHACAAPCHIGPCPPCTQTLTATCLCGKHTELRACGAYGYVALPAYARDCNVAEAEVDSACVATVAGQRCVRVFACAEVCHRQLDCGKHTCQLPCHAGPCAPCSHAPAPAELCPCQHTLFLYDGAPDSGAHPTVAGRIVTPVRVPGSNPRADCASPLRTCAHACGRTAADATTPARLLQQGLPHAGCVHPCAAQCHNGPCPPCAAAMDVPCRCGKQEVAVSCLLASFADALLHTSFLRVQGRTATLTLRGAAQTLPLSSVSALYAEMPQHAQGPLPGTNVDDAAVVWGCPAAALPHLAVDADAEAGAEPPAFGTGWFALSPQGHFLRGDIALAITSGMVTGEGRSARYLPPREGAPQQLQVSGRLVANPYTTAHVRSLRGFTSLLSTLLTLCNKRCRRVLSCGLHNCLTLCCPAPGHPHASALSHVCSAACAKYLPCGHKCSKPCHSGSCGSCELVLPGAACECSAHVTARPGSKRGARVRCGDGTSAQCTAKCSSRCVRGAAGARVASYVMSATQAMQLAAADASAAHVAVQYGSGAQALMVAPALLPVHALALMGRRPQAPKADDAGAEPATVRAGNLTVVRAPDSVIRSVAALRGVEAVFKAMPALLTPQSVTGKGSRFVAGDALVGAALLQVKLAYAHLLVCEDEAGRVVGMVEWQRAKAIAADAGERAVVHVAGAVTYSGRAGGASVSAEPALLPVDMAVFDRARFPPGVAHMLLSCLWNGMRQHRYDNAQKLQPTSADGAASAPSSAAAPASSLVDALAPPMLFATSLHPPLADAHCGYTYALADAHAGAPAESSARPAKLARTAAALPARPAAPALATLPPAYAALPPTLALLLAYPAPILAAAAPADAQHLTLFPPAGALPDHAAPPAAPDATAPAVALYLPPAKPANLQPLFPPLLLVTGTQPVCLHSCPHKCHSGACPPCSVLTPRLCSCGATVMPNVRCSSVAVQCGRECGKLLPCRRHKCVRLCHAGPCGEVATTASPTAETAVPSPVAVPTPTIAPAHAPLWNLLAPFLARTAAFAQTHLRGPALAACAAALHALATSLLPAAAPLQQRVAALTALLLPLDNTARWLAYARTLALQRHPSRPAPLPLLRGLMALTAASCAHACGRPAVCGHACGLTCHLTRADALGAALGPAVAEALDAGPADTVSLPATEDAASVPMHEDAAQQLLRLARSTSALQWLLPYLAAAGLHLLPAPAAPAGLRAALVPEGHVDAAAPSTAETASASASASVPSAAATDAPLPPCAGVEAVTPALRPLLCYSAAAGAAGLHLSATSVSVCAYDLHVADARVRVAVRPPTASLSATDAALPVPPSPSPSVASESSEGLSLSTSAESLPNPPSPATAPTAAPSAASVPVTVLPLVLFTDVPRAIAPHLHALLPACACAATCALPLLSFANALYPARCYSCAAHLWSTLAATGASAAQLCSALAPHVHGATIALTFALHAVEAPLCRLLAERGVTLPVDHAAPLEHPYSSLVMLPAHAAGDQLGASHALLTSTSISLAGLAPAAAPLVLSLRALLSSHYASARVHTPTRAPIVLSATPLPAVAAEASANAPPLPALAPLAVPLSLCAMSACYTTLSKRCFCDGRDVTVPCASDVRADTAVLFALLLAALKDAAERTADGTDLTTRAAAALNAALRSPALAVPPAMLVPLELPAPALMPALLFSFATSAAPLILAPPSAVAAARTAPTHALPVSALDKPALLPLLPLASVQSWLQRAPCVAECQQQMVVHRIARALNVNLANKHQVALLAQHADLITRAHGMHDRNEQERALQGLQSAGLSVLSGVADDGSMASTAVTSIANPALAAGVSAPATSSIDAFVQWQRKQQAPAAVGGLAGAGAGAGALTVSGGLVPYSAAFLETLLATHCDGFVPTVEHHCRAVLARAGNDQGGAAMSLPPMNAPQRSIVHATAGVFSLEARSLRAEPNGLKAMTLALQPGSVEPVFPLSEALELYRATRQVVVVHVDRHGAYHDNREQLRALAQRVKEVRAQAEAAERRAKAAEAAEADGWEPSQSISTRTTPEAATVQDSWTAGERGTDLTALLREVSSPSPPTSGDAAASVSTTSAREAAEELPDELPEWEASAE